MLATTEKKTIIITTHYIEEARKADTVSFKSFQNNFISRN